MDVAEQAGINNLADMARTPLVRSSEAGKFIDVGFYENDIPEFVAAELDRLYESVYCTLARFHIYGEAKNVHTYVARQRGNIVAVILFRVERGVVQVINQQIALAQDEIVRFSQAVFAKYRPVRRISFYAIDAKIARSPFPFQAFAALEENVLMLPPTREEYMATISEKLWKKIQAGQRKLKRDHSDFHFEVRAGRDVSEALLRRIVALAEARMAAKQRDAYIHEDDIDKILRLVHAYGFVGVLTVDGAVRAGNVFYRVGTRFFMHLIAHDPDYDKYMLGHMVQYFAACHCIELGGRECYLMGGGRENKARFRAFPKHFQSVDIYRSRLFFLLGWRRVGRGAVRRLLHAGRERFARLARTEGKAGRVAAQCLAFVRAVKRTLRGPALEYK